MVSGASIMKQTMPWSEVSEQALHCIRILQTLCPHIPLSLSPNHPPFCFRSQMAFAHLHLLLPFVTGKFLCKQWKAKTTPDSNQHTHTKFDSKANFEICHQKFSVWYYCLDTFGWKPLDAVVSSGEWPLHASTWSTSNTWSKFCSVVQVK